MKLTLDAGAKIRFDLSARYGYGYILLKSIYRELPARSPISDHPPNVLFIGFFAHLLILKLTLLSKHIAYLYPPIFARLNRVKKYMSREVGS